MDVFKPTRNVDRFPPGFHMAPFHNRQKAVAGVEVEDEEKIPTFEDDDLHGVGGVLSHGSTPIAGCFIIFIEADPMKYLDDLGLLAWVWIARKPFL